MSTSSNNLSIAAGAVVCNESVLVGDITIGARTVVHPKARIIAKAGPVIIGENNLIEEQVNIINDNINNIDTDNDDIDMNSEVSKVMIIGNNNVFEVDSECRALKVGDNNVLESKCRVGGAVELTHGCVVGAKCRLSAEEIIPENTVIYGHTNSRRKQMDRPAPQTLQIDFLAKVLPNYHHLKKPTQKQQQQQQQPQ